MIQALPDGLPNLLRGARRCLEPREVEVRLRVSCPVARRAVLREKSADLGVSGGRGRVSPAGRTSSDSAPSDHTRKRGIMARETLRDPVASGEPDGCQSCAVSWLPVSGAGIQRLPTTAVVAALRGADRGHQVHELFELVVKRRLVQKGIRLGSALPSHDERNPRAFLPSGLEEHPQIGPRAHGTGVLAREHVPFRPIICDGLASGLSSRKMVLAMLHA